MKTLYIKYPLSVRRMCGFSVIIEDLKKAHKFAEELFNCELECIDTYIITELKNPTLEDSLRHIEDCENSDYLIVIGENAFTDGKISFDKIKRSETICFVY